LSDTDDRQEHFTSLLEKAYSLLQQVEQALMLSSDPKEQRRLENDCASIQADIADLERRCNNNNDTADIPSDYPFQDCRLGDQFNPLITLIKDIIERSSHNPYDVLGLPNPYLALKSFTYEERDRYAGRTDEIRDWLEKLTTDGEEIPLLFVTGDSGSGKSSFVRAGLLPALYKYYKGYNFAVVEKDVYFKPGTYPIAALQKALAMLGYGSTLPENLFDDPEQFWQYIAANRPTNQVNIIVIDQFEELFTTSDPVQRDKLFAILASLPPFDQKTPIHIIVALRKDYWSEMLTQKAVQVKGQRYSLEPMAESKLIKAITTPVFKMYGEGKRVDPGLVKRLTADVGDDPTLLPLLQVTLSQLWEGGSLESYHYKTLTDGLESFANKIYENSDSNQTEAEREYDKEELIAILLDLVKVVDLDDRGRDGRISRRRSYVEKDSPQRVRLIERMLNGRLLSPSEEKQGADNIQMVNIIHETLIRNWSTLKEKVKDPQTRAALWTRTLFEQELALWQRSTDDVSLLLTGRKLTQAKELEEKQDIALRYPDAKKFLKRSISQDEEQRQWELKAARRRTRLAIGATVVLTLLLIIAVIAVIFAVNQNTLKEEQLKVANSRQLAAQATTLFGNRLDQGLLLSLAARRITDTVEARRSLIEGLNINPALRTYLSGHSSSVKSIAFSPDGKTLASASDDNSVILWDVTNQKQIISLKGHFSSVNSVAFSPDGKTLASASDDNTIILWDIVTQKAISRLKGHTSSVWSVAFSPDGKLLASASYDNTVILWDISKQKSITTLTNYFVNSVAFSPDGKTLASAGCSNFHNSFCIEGEITLWDVISQKSITTFKGHSFSVESIAFSSDGKTLASASDDNTIILWDVLTQKATNYLTEHSSSVWSVAFSPDGKILASASGDNTIILWDVFTQKQVNKFTGHSSHVNSIAFSPDGNSLASASDDNTIILWDITDQKPITIHMNHTSPRLSVVFSPDGKELVSTGCSKFTDDVFCTEGEIIFWDMSSQKPITTLKGHSDSVLSAAFSPDGKILASASADNTIILWDVVSQKRIATLKGHILYVNSVAFSPDGKILASASADNTIILWDVVSQKPTATLKGHSSWVYSIAFSPDGKILASASGDNTIILWDVVSQKPIATFKGHSSSVKSIAFSPDGKTLASASEDKTVILWDVVSQKRIATLKGHILYVNSVAFSPDGKTLASASEDNTIILWDVSNQKSITTFKGHSSSVKSIAFSPDGKTLASASLDKTVILWDVDPASWEKRACHIANRNLTKAEWVQFLGEDKPYQKFCPDLPEGP
jgi:WD40 repeat protein